ncbi:MAG: DUF445 family protein [SAR324 cluster bacterium]|nr:DUF445 family protein [SAR324 cluster bacterium]
MDAFNNEDFWLYVSMPFVSAIVGWGTNLVAIKMTFYPLTFWGIPPFLGWQGIIPRKAEKMASIAVDLMTTKLISVEELFDRLDPERVAKEMEPTMEVLIETLTTDIMIEQAPALWEMLPLMVKDEIFRRVRNDAPNVIARTMTEIKEHIGDLFDLKAMIIDSLVRDRSLLNKVFQDVGHKEFKFIERSGLYFGFLFGCIQMVIWIYYKGQWQLPVCGFIVGYATNWLALKMIFEPVNPIKIGPWTIQGLFIKRQQEVASDYGALIASEILNPENIIEGILKGPSSDKLFKLIQRHVKRTIDSSTGITKPFIALTMGTHRYIQMKEMAVDKVLEHLPEGLSHLHAYTEEAMDIQTILREKMKQLTAEEFIGLLRPAFQEDEWILIMVGGALGVAVGFFQLLVMFSGRF